MHKKLYQYIYFTKTLYKITENVTIATAAWLLYTNVFRPYSKT